MQFEWTDSFGDQGHIYTFGDDTVSLNLTQDEKESTVHISDHETLRDLINALIQADHELFNQPAEGEPEDFIDIPEPEEQLYLVLVAGESSLPPEFRSASPTSSFPRVLDIRFVHADSPDQAIEMLDNELHFGLGASVTAIGVGAERIVTKTIEEL